MVWRRRKRVRISYEQQGFHRGKFAVPAPRGRRWKDTDFVVMYGLYSSSGLNAYLAKRRWRRLSALDRHTLAARRIEQDANAFNVVGVENGR
jgi:hypothetical protein